MDAPSLALAKRLKNEAILRRTDELNRLGVLSGGGRYISTLGELDNLVWLEALGPAGFFPRRVLSADGTAIATFANPAAFSNFYDAVSASRNNYNDGGLSLIAEVNAAMTVAEVNAIVDNRMPS